MIPHRFLAVVITARTSYAKCQTVLDALIEREQPVEIVAAGSALLDRYGAVVKQIAQEFPTLPITAVWTTLEGAQLVTSAKETGNLLYDLAGRWADRRPRAVVVIADRHEVLAAAQAASYLNIPLVHLQGGERSGNIDNRVRDAITHLADVHCVSTERARWRVYGLTGEWAAIYQTGCPSIDLALQAQQRPPVMIDEVGGMGAQIDLRHPFVMVLQHPVTTEVEAAWPQMWSTLTSLAAMAPRYPLLVFWPGQDAGAEATSKAIRQFHIAYPDYPVHFVRNLQPCQFLRLLGQTACLVGNSSAGIREASAIGTPVLNIGPRQDGRERAINVRDIHAPEMIGAAVKAQIARGPCPPSTLYGDGTAGAQIADVLCTIS